MQNALNKKAKLLYVVFDVLFVSNEDVRQRPLLERKELLKALLPRDPLLRYSDHVAQFGKREFAKAQRAHEEGVIAKRAASLTTPASGRANGSNSRPCMSRKW
jgi:bifunctional non-homologous end joining protein LigD